MPNFYHLQCFVKTLHILTGKHISKQTKRTFFEELAKAKANTAKLKSLVVKEDEDNDLF